MIKCKECEKKINNKEEIRFSTFFNLPFLFPVFYCKKCAFSKKRKFNPIRNPMKLKTYLSFILFMTFITIAVLVFFLIAFSEILLIIALFLFVFSLSDWVAYFWLKRKINSSYLKSRH